MLAWPKGKRDVATNDRAAKSVASEATNHTSLAKQTLRRQTLKVGARCGNTARRDLCGGRVVTRVPTAIGRSRTTNDHGVANPVFKCRHVRKILVARGWTGRMTIETLPKYHRATPYVDLPGERPISHCSVAPRVPRSSSVVKYFLACRRSNQFC